ncbi:MAG: glycoside hydrolase family 3 protein [Candidatus Kapabacteria bacterium]|nr:glycoside hydrolase family 3 protein [Candidatus Kapabacteria bacterium]
MQSITSFTDLKLAAECIFPRLDIERYISQEDYKKDIIRLVELGVGGFCIFKGNIEEAKTVIAEVRAVALYPLLITADYEHGVTMRHEGGTAFPHAMALGKTGDLQKTQIVAQLIARETKALGVNVNFAPVCDINSNPINPIINIRSFGEEANIVGTHASAYAKGLQSENVIACAKHFPGHGDTSIDSHLSLPILEHSLEIIEEREIKPFEQIFKNGVRSVMVGHLSVPSIDKTGMPASLSKTIISGYLLAKMNFQGLIFTDALDMKSIASTYSSTKASEMCIRAGADVALLPENPFEAIEHFEKLLKNDNDFKNDLIRAAKKIRIEKEWCGLGNFRRLLEEEDEEKKVNLEHERVALSVAMSALDMDINESEYLPIDETLQIAGFAFLQTDSDFKSASMFFNLLSQAVENNMDYAYLDESISEEDLQGMCENTRDADLVIIAFFNRAKAYHGSIGISENMKRIIERLKNNNPTINIFFGNPYLRKEIKGSINICTFSDSLASIAASVLALSGRSNQIN